MIKTITLGEKEVKLKSSAATNILYKKAFGDDILTNLSRYAKSTKKLQKMQADLNAMREDTTKTPEEILEVSTAILDSEEYKVADTFRNETMPRLSFIMWLEANESEHLFQKLNEEQYLFWLMTVDQDELIDLVGEVMDIWQAGARTHSKPKN